MTARHLLLLANLALVAGCALVLPSRERHDPVEEAVALIQEHRREAGCRDTLIWDEIVEEVAERHTIDMLTSNRIRHVNADGDDVGIRLARGGVQFRMAAENLAAGPVRGERVVTLWYLSNGHRRNMLNCAYTHHALVYRRAYWTHVLVRYTQ